MLATRTCVCALRVCLDNSGNGKIATRAPLKISISIAHGLCFISYLFLIVIIIILHYIEFRIIIWSWLVSAEHSHISVPSFHWYTDHHQFEWFPHMNVPCSLGYFECQHVAPNCCCHIRKASITTCLLVAHWQSKLQVSFCTRSTTVSKTQSVYRQIYGLGESFAPDAVTSYKAGTSMLWLLPQIGQSRLLHLLSITRQYSCSWLILHHTRSNYIITV